MLRTVSFWQHFAVSIPIVAMTALVGLGVLGAGDQSLLRPEYFVAKQVTVAPDGGDGVRIREVVDIDFGINQRHGYQRIIPNDFGEPTDVTAWSPDADAEVGATTFARETRIRLGDPNTTYTGRHRYVLEYTLPDANVSGGRLDLDIIGNDETFQTERFEVVLTGFEFESLDCFTGARAAVDGCEFVRGPSDNFVTLIEPLKPAAGITVSGAITALTTPAVPEIPAQPSGGSFELQPFGLAMIPIGVAAALIVYQLGRRAGSNTVLAGGATEAAFGDLPLPRPGLVGGRDDAGGGEMATFRVPDSKLADMATIEFTPPRGLLPWQAAVVLTERVDGDSVSAWFAKLIADEALVATKHDDKVWLTRGEAAGRLNAVDQGHVQRLFANGEVVKLGTYDKEFAAVWRTVLGEQRTFARTAGWWDRGGPGGSITTPTKLIVGAAVTIALVSLIAVIIVSATSSAFWRVLGAPWLAIALGFLLPLVFAGFAYQRMFASRTATGSALALRSESFRRFLNASEGQHVEWAWKQGLLREYSAWAVALGAAKAWSTAVHSSNIPDQQVDLSGPLLLYSASSAFASTSTAPSSSSGGGGGGVGGGGGGGSSGSW